MKKRDHDYHCMICDMVYLAEHDAWMPRKTYVKMNDGRLNMTTGMCGETDLCRLAIAMFATESESDFDDYLKELYGDAGLSHIVEEWENEKK